ncbi:MAG: hypothetical protein AAFR27_12110, partial [Pseudomonadota bacterium]
ASIKAFGHNIDTVLLKRLDLSVSEIIDSHNNRGGFTLAHTLAPELEKRMGEGETTTVIVAVDDFGNAQIKAFQQDGINIVTERLY